TSIPEGDWQSLDLYLSRVPAAKAGLYRMWEPRFMPATETPPRIVHEVPPPLGELPSMSSMTSTGMAGETPKPWFKTTAGIVGIAAVAALVGFITLGSLVK